LIPARPAAKFRLRHGCPLRQPASGLRRKEGVMNIVKFNPFRELEEIQGRLNRFFADVPTRDEAFAFPDWTPPVDIQEAEKEYTVTVELPEMKKENIKVNVENGMLTIEGERRLEKEEKNKKYHRVERQYGRFVRRFAMPGEIEAGHVHAEYKDGVLKVTLPKAAAAMPKTVDVKVA
jgi:HSP20 family protein